MRFRHPSPGEREHKRVAGVAGGNADTSRRVDHGRYGRGRFVKLGPDVRVGVSMNDVHRYRDPYAGFFRRRQATRDVVIGAIVISHHKEAQVCLIRISGDRRDPGIACGHAPVVIRVERSGELAIIRLKWITCDPFIRRHRRPRRFWNGNSARAGRHDRPGGDRCMRGIRAVDD